MGWLGLTFLVGCMLLDQAAGLLPSSAPFIGVIAGVQCSPRVTFRRASESIASRRKRMRTERKSQ